jgi:Mor transcription activator family
MSQTPKIPKEYLPETIQYLLTLISMESVLILIKTKGGTYIEIPVKAKPKHWLADLIGMDDFNALVSNFGYTRLEIPRCDRLTKLARDIKIFQDSMAGITNPKLALKYQMTTRTIRKILPEMKQLEQKPWFNEIQSMAAIIL